MSASRHSGWRLPAMVPAGLSLPARGPEERPRELGFALDGCPSRSPEDGLPCRLEWTRAAHRKGHEAQQPGRPEGWLASWATRPGEFPDDDGGDHEGDAPG